MLINNAILYNVEKSDTFNGTIMISSEIFEIVSNNF